MFTYFGLERVFPVLRAGIIRGNSRGRKRKTAQRNTAKLNQLTSQLDYPSPN